MGADSRFCFTEAKRFFTFFIKFLKFILNRCLLSLFSMSFVIFVPSCEKISSYPYFFLGVILRKSVDHIYY